MFIVRGTNYETGNHWRVAECETLKDAQAQALTYKRENAGASMVAVDIDCPDGTAQHIGMCSDLAVQ